MNAKNGDVSTLALNGGIGIVGGKESGGRSCWEFEKGFGGLEERNREMRGSEIRAESTIRDQSML